MARRALVRVSGVASSRLRRLATTALTAIIVVAVGGAGVNLAMSLRLKSMRVQERARAEKIAFTPAYVEIEATYLVPAGSPIQRIEDVDRAGVRIAVTARAAYDLWLERALYCQGNQRVAQFVHAEGPAFVPLIERWRALAGSW